MIAIASAACTDALGTAACPYCALYQPGELEYFAVGVAALVVAATFVFALKCLLRPEEKATEHIKRRVLEGEHGRQR